MQHEPSAAHAPVVLVATGDEWLARSIESILAPNGVSVIKALQENVAKKESISARGRNALAYVVPAHAPFEMRSHCFCHSSKWAAQ